MITLILSADKNWLIGKNNDLPWRIPEDLQHFKETTTGKSVVMGRKTWDSLPKKPLPGRQNIVISTKNVENCVCVNSLDKAIQAAVSDVFIIGGAQIFELALRENKVDRILLSRVRGDFVGDIYFPKIDESQWDFEVLREFKDFDLIEVTPLKRGK